MSTYPELSFHTWSLEWSLPELLYIGAKTVSCADVNGTLTAAGLQAANAAGITTYCRYFSSTFSGKRNWDGARPELVGTPQQYHDDVAARPWYPYATWIALPNEPVSTQVQDAGWQAACVVLFHADSKKVLVGNWDYTTVGWYIAGADLYSVHDYGWPDISSGIGISVLVFPTYFPTILSSDPSAKLLIGECGLNHGIIGGPNEGVS